MKTLIGMVAVAVLALWPVIASAAETGPGQGEGHGHGHHGHHGGHHGHHGGHGGHGGKGGAPSVSAPAAPSGVGGAASAYNRATDKWGNSRSRDQALADLQACTSPPTMSGGLVDYDTKPDGSFTYGGYEFAEPDFVQCMKDKGYQLETAGRNELTNFGQR